MNQRMIPCCYFPSTVVFVDDNQDFLTNIELHIDSGILCKTYNSAPNALEELIKAQKQSAQLNNRCFTEYLESSRNPLSTQTVNLNLAAIHWEVYNPQRFKETAVVVVDYDMPIIDGLEFCKQLENTSYKKILLTGKATINMAVKAFNEGIIDSYIQKNESNMLSYLNETVLNLQLKYFQNMSDMISQVLAVNAPHCLTDKKFINFFNDLCQERNIVEFYLTESSGSFFLLDADGQPSCLIIKSEQDLKLHYDLALDNNSSPEILRQLRNGERIPYFWQSDDLLHGKWTDWNTCLYPAQKLECEHTYYYAMVDSPFAFDIQRERILSFNEYRQRQDHNAKKITESTTE